MIRLLCLIALLPLGNAWAALVSDPVDLGFTCISNNSPLDCSRGESFMSVRIGTATGDDGKGNLLTGTNFTFFNNLDSGTDGANIEEVYIDSMVLDGYDFVKNVLFIPSGAAAYQQTAVKPGNLPAGNEVGFIADWGAEPLKNQDCRAVITKGDCSIETLEQYTINFGALAFDTVAMALMANEFILGIHVVGYNSGGSESFVTSIPNPVPIPATFWLFGTALVGFIGYSRRTQL